MPVLFQGPREGAVLVAFVMALVLEYNSLFYFIEFRLFPQLTFMISSVMDPF